MKCKHLAPCGGRIHESFDRMLARYYGIPMPKMPTSTEKSDYGLLDWMDEDTAPPQGEPQT